jgi:hypothetical protein
MTSVAAPLRAGVAVSDMRGYTHAAPQPVVEQAPPAPPLRLPYWKRLALRLLRPLKSAINPVLFRAQTRMASAVDSSFTASVVQGLEREMRAQLTRIETDMIIRFSMMSDEVHDSREAADIIRVKLEDNLAIILLQVNEGRALDERLDAFLGRSLIPLKGAVALRTADGYVLAPADDDSLIVDLVERAGRPSPGLQALIGRLLGQGGGLAEIGAHDGRLAVAAARLVGPGGQVLTFGRDEACTALIDRAAQLNRTPWLQARNAGSVAQALSDAASAGARIDLVHIAGEADPAALRQDIGRIHAGHPQVAVIVRPGSPAGHAAWRAVLEADGFKAWALDPATGGVRPLSTADGLGDPGAAELVFTRDAATEARLVRS